MGSAAMLRLWWYWPSPGVVVIAALRTHKVDSVTAATARLRALCDYLVWQMFDDAERDIDAGAAIGLPWVVIRLPHPCDDEMRRRWAEVMGYGAEHGYPNMRPGSPAGHACDFIRLERAS